MSHPTPASHKVLTRPVGRGPGTRSVSSPGMFLTWTTDASTGLTWGRSEPGTLRPSPRPAEQESALEQVTAGQGRVQEAAPEIWPLLTAPWSPSSSLGSLAPAPLGASPLSGHAELAPGAALVCPSAGSSLPGLGVAASPCHPGLQEHLSPCAPSNTQECQPHGDKVRAALVHPCPPGSSVKKHSLMVNEYLG